MMEMRDLAHYFREKSPEDVLRYFLSGEGMTASNTCEERIALASSLGAEDQVLTHMVLKIHPGARIFILDTGRFHSETYELIQQSMRHFGIHYEIRFPDSSAIEEMESRFGPNLFLESIEHRKRCCHVRKVASLRKVLATLDVWITGLRRTQAVTRGMVEKIEWDETNGLIKLNPLADWSEERVWEYIRENNIPYNRLHDQGYPSIGCAPCTRAIRPEEDARAGRWWWEAPEHKECGLHSAAGKIVRRT